MRLVLVDPSRVTAKVIASALESRGHHVTTFTDSAAALEHVGADASVEVLITSLTAEPISGIELCWRTRLIAGTRRPLYILVMSSLRNARNLAEALDAGADDFIDKPPSHEELDARLRAGARLMSMQRELIHLAEIDSLSGLLNRRAFFDRLRRAIADLDADGAMSAIMLDVDHFKRVNDTYGHDAGDMVIKGVAKELAIKGALAGRMGGEEFAMILPGHGTEAAAAVAEGLRLCCAELCFGSEPNTFRVTSSFGISGWLAGDTPDSILRRADCALYEAKRGGRNRIATAAVGMTHAHGIARSRPEVAPVATALPAPLAVA